MIRKNLFVIFWVLIIIALLLFSLVFRETNTTVVAQVEPMKKAVSYHKAVKIIEIYVIAFVVIVVCTHQGGSGQWAVY